MKLIDADKLLYDLANEDIPPDVHAFVLDKIEQGLYDPINIPRIKVGDRVWHKDHKCPGTVITISNAGDRAYVDWEQLIFTGSVRVADLSLVSSSPKEDTQG